ncbi:Protein BCP1 [Spathaspora sp. JA1]|nr:Protein BCP1 [Spathaspora sp. JA1]
MAKRKQDQDSDSDIDVSSTDEELELEQGEEQPEEEETVNVDFDFFDLNPEVDFQALKNFLRQLFGDDAGQIDTSGLADLILTKHSIGTAIKTDGMESDPFALISIVNINENVSNPSVKLLLDYILSKTKNKTQFNIMLKKLFHGKAAQFKTGLIISERLINMPIEVVPPMYNMLLDEMSRAEDSHEKYEFDYFLIISKVYQLVSGIEQEEETSKAKKKKIASDEPKPVEMDYFHYEDMVFEEHASYKGVFDYSEQKQETDSRRVFSEYGIDPKLSLLLLDKQQMKKAVEEMQVRFPAPVAE